VFNISKIKLFVEFSNRKFLSWQALRAPDGKCLAGPADASFPAPRGNDSGARYPQSAQRPGSKDGTKVRREVNNSDRRGPSSRPAG
jgi:hypothetical protein